MISIKNNKQFIYIKLYFLNDYENHVRTSLQNH